MKVLKKRRDDLKKLLENYRIKINDQENRGDTALAVDMKKEMKLHINDLAKINQ